MIHFRLRRPPNRREGSFYERLTPGARFSIVFPFIIIVAALSVLAWRAYELSIRMERGLTALSVQYLGYAAEITATRADTVVRELMTGTAEDFRLLERSSGTADYTALQQWTLRHPWIVSALYIPDDDPEQAVFVREGELAGAGEELEGEFYTAQGAIEYTWDPEQVLSDLRDSIVRTPEIHAPHLPEAEELRKSSRVQLVRRSDSPSVGRAGEALMVTVPLAPPLSEWAIRASVETTWAGTGFSSPRILSLLIAGVAMIVVMLGTFFALRGLGRAAEANQLRAALIANVSHELRTPLAMIRLGVETLKRGEGRLPQETRTQMLDSMLRESLHLHHLVENVLDVARLQEGGKPPSFSPVDPVELVRSVVSNYSAWFASKGFSVELALEENVDEQHWDRDAISRAVLNLIDNAIKYSRNDKVVTVGVHQRESAIEIWVEDRGLGIQPSEVTRIFDPYYRASFSDTESRRGAGLGLTLVQQIVAAHGGTIEVDSHPGIGSTFRLVFPRLPAR